MNVTPKLKLCAENVNVGDGAPVAVTVNDPAVPTVKVVLEALVIVGAVGGATVRVKLCVAFGNTPFEAVRVRG